jgi:hypothetical protein
MQNAQEMKHKMHDRSLPETQDYGGMSNIPSPWHGAMRKILRAFRAMSNSY